MIIFSRGMEGTLRTSNSGGLRTRGPRLHRTRPMAGGTRADCPPESFTSSVPAVCIQHIWNRDLSRHGGHKPVQLPTVGSGSVRNPTHLEPTKFWGSSPCLNCSRTDVYKGQPTTPMQLVRSRVYVLIVGVAHTVV